MREILPGVWHWTTVHEVHGIEISSYHLEEERVVIDPCVPAEGLDWFVRKERATGLEPATLSLEGRKTD